MDSLGFHDILDFYDCPPNRIDDVDYVEDSLTEAADRMGATIVAVEFNLFEPHGVSGMVVISESHLAIHTWPEYRFTALDLFTCSEEFRFDPARQYLEERFEPSRTETRELARGDFAQLPDAVADDESPRE